VRNEARRSFIEELLLYSLSMLWNIFAKVFYRYYVCKYIMKRSRKVRR